jgi:Mrp family chromosome partitioning ATPase
LGSPNFVELLAWAEATYEQVLVDCPPVLAVSDAQIVGRLVDGAILVVQPHKNHRRLVARACQSFSATGSTVLGIVANGLSLQAGRGYGYGYGYGYAYGYGHDAEPEAPGSTVVESPGNAQGEETIDILSMTNVIDSGEEIDRMGGSRGRRSRRSRRAA